MNSPKGDKQWKSRIILGVVCILVVGIFYWSAEPGFFESASPQAKDSYYNLLVQGFRAGQLNVQRDAPMELAKLANPYDPATNAACVWDINSFCYEMSYYNGKLYLYYGVTPAIVLFWPYAIITGHYCSHQNAVVIFFAVGFLAAAGLLHASWRRYFCDVSVWVVGIGMLSLGLATGILGILASCDLHEVPHSCGFAFTMLSLVAVWNVLHKPKQQIFWLALGSLFYGLAIGSRPSLLFGAIILLVPVIYAWRAASKPISFAKMALIFAAAIVPITMIGFGLMIYNALRFDNPFEFGWRYQLTDIQNKTAQPFSLHYLWFNFKLYFFEPIRWVSHFPFLQTNPPASLPQNYYAVGGGYCGILLNYPLAWLALFAPLALKRRPPKKIIPLCYFLWAAFLLFATCALTLCLFFSGSSGYLPDFLPALMLLAVIGIFASENWFKDSRVKCWLFRLIWILLFAYSTTFNVLAGVKTHAGANYILGNSFAHQGRDNEALEHFQKAEALDPNSAAIHLGLGRAFAKKWGIEEAMNHFRKAIEIEPANMEAQYDLGLSLIQSGRIDEAAACFEKVSKIKTNFAEIGEASENNNWAWTLATNSDPSKRNGTLAVILAEAACRKTNFKVTVMVGTLAAAYAEAGRFDDAIVTAEKACALAAQSGDEQLLQKNRELLTQYRRHQPYHQNQNVIDN